MINPDLQIPAQFRREPSPRALDPTGEQRREAHRIAVSCAELLERDRKRRTKLSRANKKARNRRVP